MTLRACKKCQIVNKQVELYYNELGWQGPPEYLCVECQKNVFRFHVIMLILGTMMHKDKSEDFKADVRKMTERVAAHAKKNRIKEEYWMKLVEREVSKINSVKE